MKKSENFRLSFMDGQILNQLKAIDSLTEGVAYFIRRQQELSNYGYWAILSVLWKYRNRELPIAWKLLFLDQRPLKKEWLMMENGDFEAYKQLPANVTVYQIQNERQDIAYTPHLDTAKKWVKAKVIIENENPIINEYTVNKKNILAYFKENKEVIILEERHLTFKRNHAMINNAMYLSPHFKGDKGITCMPLVANVPIPKDTKWKKTSCPNCGEECWETSLIQEQEAKESLKKMCTRCALVSASRGEV